MVEALLDEQADDAVGVEEEVAAGGALVADDGVEGLELGGVGEGGDRGRDGGGGARRGGEYLRRHGRTTRPVVASPEQSQAREVTRVTASPVALRSIVSVASCTEPYSPYAGT